MSDQSVSDALRSEAALVVIEAPAGCGKTFQAARFAKEWAENSDVNGSLLILTHTHAACAAFSSKIGKAVKRITVNTIDGIIVQIASIYHAALDVPSDASIWARNRADGFDELAEKVAKFLERAPGVSQALAMRYPIVVCDEHQDTSINQNNIILSLLAAGSRLRIFGDPMQAIYGTAEDLASCRAQWDDLVRRADIFDELDYPHRWKHTNLALGEWVLAARQTLKNQQPIDLSVELPDGLEIVQADNKAKRFGMFQTDALPTRRIRADINKRRPAVVLSTQTATIRGLNAFFGRRLPIWEGHTREALFNLVSACKKHQGNAKEIGIAACDFLEKVCTGFGKNEFGNLLVKEIENGCVKARKLKPALIQSLARILLETPNHEGVGRMLQKLKGYVLDEHSFSGIKIDLRSEFHDGAQLSKFEDPELGCAEILRRHSVTPLEIPTVCISTVHKAKGLEFGHVLLVPCDSKNFADSDAKRCLLYVALSRAMNSLTLVVSPNSSSPLIKI